jgi:hypothetical protein
LIEESGEGVDYPLSPFNKNQGFSRLRIKNKTIDQLNIYILADYAINRSFVGHIRVALIKSIYIESTHKIY